jgi:hypothetical protein
MGSSRGCDVARQVTPGHLSTHSVAGGVVGEGKWCPYRGEHLANNMRVVRMSHSICPGVGERGFEVVCAIEWHARVG